MGDWSRVPSLVPDLTDPPLDPFISLAATLPPTTNSPTTAPPAFLTLMTSSGDAPVTMARGFWVASMALLLLDLVVLLMTFQRLRQMRKRLANSLFWAWLLLVIPDSVLVLTLLPFNVYNLVVGIQAGAWCSISAGIAVAAACSWNCGAAAVAYITYLCITSASTRSYERLTQLTGCVAWGFGIAIAAGFHTTLNLHRGLYCSITTQRSHFAAAIVVLSLFLVFGTLTTFFYCRAFAMAKSTTASVVQSSNLQSKKARPMLGGLARRSILMVLLYFVTWSPVSVLAVLDLAGLGYPAGWDIVAGLLVLALPLWDCWLLWSSLTTFQNHEDFRRTRSGGSRGMSQCSRQRSLAHPRGHSVLRSQTIGGTLSPPLAMTSITPLASPGSPADERFIFSTLSAPRMTPPPMWMRSPSLENHTHTRSSSPCGPSPVGRCAGGLTIVLDEPTPPSIASVPLPPPRSQAESSTPENRPRGPSDPSDFPVPSVACGVGEEVDVSECEYSRRPTGLRITVEGEESEFPEPESRTVVDSYIFKTNSYQV